MATPAGVQERSAPEGPGIGWVKLLRWSTIAAIVTVALINVFAGLIPPLVVFAVVWIGALVWLGKATKGPAILLLVSFVANIVLSAPFVIPTITVPASGGDFILNLAGLLAALTGIVSAIYVIRNVTGPSGAARGLAMGAAALFVVGTAFSIFATISYDSAVAEEGDIRLVTKDLEFQPASFDAEAGTVSVFIDNEDGTLHTFTIDDLDVDLDIPASKSARVTFEAEPGDYEFFCAPHKEDMEGTLTVE